MSNFARNTATATRGHELLGLICKISTRDQHVFDQQCVSGVTSNNRVTNGPKMGKKDGDVSMEDDAEEESIIVLSPIANPLAKDKLVKKILKLVKAGKLRSSPMRIALLRSMPSCIYSICPVPCGSSRHILPHCPQFYSFSM